MVPARERLTYLFGEEALDELDDYDLRVESDVREVVERFLPVRSDSDLAGAASVVRTVVVRQILDDDPPATWQAVERMRLAGLGRDRVLSQLSMVVYAEILDGLDSGEPSDPARLVQALDQLPVPSAEQLAEAMVAVARTNRGITADEHIERVLTELGSSTTRRILEPLVDRVLDHLTEGPLHWLPGDVTVVFHDAVAGRVFTHRLNDTEREIGALSVSVDLAAWGRFDVVRLADGTELDQLSLEGGHLAWHGPQGWLDQFAVGDLLAVTAAFDPPAGDEPVEATVTITVVADEPAMTDELVAAVSAAYSSEHVEHGLPVTAEELTVWLCHYHPELFTSPLPPVSDCCDAAGLDISGNMIAHDDSVWRNDLLRRRKYALIDRVPEDRWRDVLGRAVEVLPDPEASLDDVCRSLGECAEAETLDVLADLLIPELLQPDDEFARETVESPGHVFELVQRATAVARRPRERATAEYLACVLHERCGQPLTAAEHLARTVDAQPRLGPAIERMGWYCFDRGDARGAMRWWRELDDVPSAASVIASFVAPTTGRTKLGRNDPCWCGSGRKFKQCHQVSNELPTLPERVAWLCTKASLWMQHATDDARLLMADLLMAWMAGDPDPDETDIVDDEEAMQAQFDRALDDPIVLDAALHEGRLFERFLYERGDLLPDDERLLASAWLTVERSVHEVVAVERGVGMTLRDLATGDVSEVRERTASQIAHVGERYCARVVPDGATNQIVGGIFPVRTGDEQAVLDLCARADPYEVCAWAGALAQPPRIVHTPGMLDSMLDRDAVQAAIDELGEADEATVLDVLNREVSRQLQTHWLDDPIPALDGLTPRQAAADPTRREQLERLLDEFDRRAERMGIEGVTGGPIGYDTAALRSELGLT